MNAAVEDTAAMTVGAKCDVVIFHAVAYMARDREWQCSAWEQPKHPAKTLLLSRFWAGLICESLRVKMIALTWKSSAWCCDLHGKRSYLLMSRDVPDHLLQRRTRTRWILEAS